MSNRDSGNITVNEDVKKFLDFFNGLFERYTSVKTISFYISISCLNSEDIYLNGNTRREDLEEKTNIDKLDRLVEKMNDIAHSSNVILDFNRNNSFYNHLTDLRKIIVEERKEEEKRVPEIEIFHEIYDEFEEDANRREDNYICKLYKYFSKFEKNKKRDFEKDLFITIDRNKKITAELYYN